MVIHDLQLSAQGRIYKTEKLFEVPDLKVEDLSWKNGCKRRLCIQFSKEYEENFLGFVDVLKTFWSDIYNDIETIDNPKYEGVRKSSWF